MLRIFSIVFMCLWLAETALAADPANRPSSTPVPQAYGRLLSGKDVSSLPASAKSSIHQLAFRLRHERGGSCIVLHAHSGTAKTQAASLLAASLGRQAYAVDLSAVVSKYIGETEKNLNKLFASAAANRWVLLFDEADALFGKRSEVKDSHDRYANVETGYLLERLEAYKGIWILTSNSRLQLKPGLEKRCKHALKL